MGECKLLVARITAFSHFSQTMIIHPRHFIRFLDGRGGNAINIAFLPGDLGACIQTLETSVKLRLDYAKKLLTKHKVRYQGFEYIQEAIDNGMCIQENETHLRFLYAKDNVKPEIYLLVVKTDARRKELWLVTFHKIGKRQFSAKTAPKAVIRLHMERDFSG